jgi:hypothetical protein
MANTAARLNNRNNVARIDWNGRGTNRNSDARARGCRCRNPFPCRSHHKSQNAGNGGTFVGRSPDAGFGEGSGSPTYKGVSRSKERHYFHAELMRGARSWALGGAKEARQRGLPNLHLTGLRPRERISDSYACASINSEFPLWRGGCRLHECWRLKCIRSGWGGCSQRRFRQCRYERR